MLKRHEVEILLKAGHAKTEVARLSGVSLRSVKRIAEQRPVEHVEDARERVKRQIGRPNTLRISGNRWLRSCGKRRIWRRESQSHGRNGSRMGSRGGCQSLMQDNTKKRTMHLQSTTVVFNEAKLPESVHKEIHARAGGANQF